MRTLHAYLLFVATLLTSMGYGATFLLTEHFRALGGSEIETGTTLGGAMLGTLVGVPLVGWFAWRLGAGRMAGLGAMLVACGYLGLASLSTLTPLIGVAGFFIGLGWGIFFLAAPMALSMRVADQDRGFWFTRYGAFQMGGIGLSPIVASALISEVGLTTGQAFGAVTLICLLAALLLAVFETIAVRPVAAAIKAAGNAWVRALPALLRTRAIYPILMVGLGACVFSGLLTFQTSLVRGTGLQASTFFAVYAITVVASRFLLAPVIGRARGDHVAVILLAVMIAGVIVAFGLAYGVVVQIASAILLGVGYGLVYSVIQTQAVNDAPAEHRNAALTWFVVAYFLGVFGFPMLGGWLIVNVGTSGFLVAILLFAMAEIGLALLRGQRLAAEDIQAT
ncbi:MULTISPECIES: MFS transporter [Mesorhizobium]|uniref:MFS transporter n=1 Tax=Mesorhizobium TaxID=68287 RepID=UPI0010A96B0A|nr:MULTISPECIES: MFS transporter [Mesorhizobium]